MEKFEKLVTEYNCSQYDNLPKFIKKRCDALKKIQLEQIKLQQQFHQELHELELKYDKIYQPLYQKRFEIISGKHEPTEEESKLPESLSENKQNGDQENIEKIKNEVEFSEEEETQLKSKVKGIPSFWLGCFSSTYNFNDSIEDHDRPVLKHLEDIKLIYGQKDDYVTYTLEFHFSKNSYFSNEVLTKTYYLRSKADEKDPFSYEGYEVCKSEGCEINWLPGKNITTKTITVKQKNKNDGRTREKKKEIDRDSFFFFFKPPEPVSESEEEHIDEELGSIMAVDFELGEVIRQSIIPNAPLYYDGYMIDEDDEDEDDESDDEDDSDSDGHDYASSSEDGQDEDESNDSLNASLVKKE